MSSGGNSKRTAGLTCAVVFNAAGGLTTSQMYVGIASLAAQRLRMTATHMPSACATFCVRLFVEDPVAQLLRRTKLADAWDSIDTYPPIPPISSARSSARSSRSKHYQGTERGWLLRISALLASKEDLLAFMDSDVMACDGWPDLFDWFAHSGLDVASTKPSAPFSGSLGNSQLPAPFGMEKASMPEWANFAERNLGFGLLRCAPPALHGRPEHLAASTLCPPHSTSRVPPSALSHPPLGVPTLGAHAQLSRSCLNVSSSNSSASPMTPRCR